MILFIKHIDIEGPGTIESYFVQKGYQTKTIDLGRADQLPSDASEFEAIICLGGPMNVYEEDRFSFLRKEDLFLKSAIKQDIPLLGICLGSQLISKACGSRVIKSPVKEVGWFKVQLKEAGRQDPLFKGLDAEFDVFHWHEDMFEIPQGAVFLAGGAGCPNQAFRVGQYVYGLQFHVEVTRAIIADWCKAYIASTDPEKQRKASDMLKAYDRIEKTFDQQSEILYQNFSDLILARQKKMAPSKG